MPQILLLASDANDLVWSCDGVTYTASKLDIKSTRVLFMDNIERTTFDAVITFPLEDVEAVQAMFKTFSDKVLPNTKPMSEIKINGAEVPYVLHKCICSHIRLEPPLPPRKADSVIRMFLTFDVYAELPPLSP